MNPILAEHAPLKRVNKYKIKFKSKPWITPAIQKSISVKNNWLKIFINSKDPQTKEIIHEQYKDYRNMLSILLKIAKQIIITNILTLRRKISKYLERDQIYNNY